MASSNHHSKNHSQSTSSLNTNSSSFNTSQLLSPPPYLAYPNSDLDYLIPHQNTTSSANTSPCMSSLASAICRSVDTTISCYADQPLSMPSSFQSPNTAQSLFTHALTKPLLMDQGAPNPRTTVPGLYSSSGFDIMGVLSKVSSRSNPHVSLGPVDMSCSFVVSDARLADQPIVYVSETFEKLTGYSAIDCIGRNCRFLQSPDGLVTEGAHRRYTDNATVFQLKSALLAKQESQFTLINYKLGGEPFINLITIIPITWEHDNEVAYFVGFQIDLVEQPNAIMQRMRDGTYVVNYQVAKNPVSVSRMLPIPKPVSDSSRPPNASNHAQMQAHVGELGIHSNTSGASVSELGLLDPSGSACEPSTMLEITTTNGGNKPIASLSTGGHGAGTTTATCSTSTSGPNALTSANPESHHANLTGHFAMDVTDLVGIRDTVEAANVFYKALVNQVDFIHVLSLRGILLYVSQDSQRLLEYEDRELVGRSLSEFCHPGDLVSVMRELKESSNGVHMVNMVYRIRRKYSGYIWMEVSGKCTQGEKAKGKKFVVLTGREKPVVRVHQQDIVRAGGVNQADVWAKLALEGLFLHVSTDAQLILGFTDAELVGKSLLDLVHIDDLKSLRYALDLVRKANVVTLTHRIKNKKGEYKTVSSGFVPGNSATSGSVKFALYRCTHGTAKPPTAESGALVLGDLVAYPASAVVDDKDDFFDVLSPVRCTSWQYELHQLRLQNRRLRAEIEDVEAMFRGTKRKRKHGASTSSSSSAGNSVTGCVQMDQTLHTGGASAMDYVNLNS